MSVELEFHRRLHRPGVLVDIGAHDGAFTLPFAALPGAEVVAFEPLPVAFARLCAAVGGRAGVTLHACALGDREGVASLALPVLDGVPQEQWASIAKGYAGADPRVDEARVEVAVRTLDSFGLERVRAIKLDAEGAEYAVLRGARATLARWRPVVSVELEERHSAGSTWAVPGWLDGMGYEVVFELDGAWRGIAEFDRGTMQVASPNPAVFAVSDPYVFTFYGLPREDAAGMLRQLEG